MDYLPGISEIFLATLIVFVLLSCFLKREHMFWPWSGTLLVITDSLPWIVLNIHRLHNILVDIMERKNGTYICRGKWVGSTDFLATVDPANIHYITTSKFPNYPKGDEYRKILDGLGYALFNSDGEDWKNYRRLLHTPIKSQAFFKYSIKTAHAKLEQVLAPLLKHVSHHKDHVLDLQDVFQRFALDVAFKALTGHDPESLAIYFPLVPFLGAMADFEGGIIYRTALPQVLWKLQLLLGVGPETKLKHAHRVIRGYISNIVYKKRHDIITNRQGKVDEDDEEGADLLTLLLTELLKDATLKTHITNINDVEYFEDTTLQQLLAARDTTSSAMTWFIWLMITHPEVENKIREELRAMIPGAKEEKWRVFNNVETSKLVYLHAALNESLRLYPPAPLQYKTPRQPDVLPSGHRVHPKMKIVIPLYAMGRMRSIWGANCRDFEPERWISERGIIKHEPSSKFFVFYAGPRSCMGKEVAMTQMKMVAATLVHNFRFELVQGQDITPDVSIILHMKHGLKVKVHNRWE